MSEAARKAGIANPLRFAGQYFSSETGLHYNRHRYYDPNSGASSRRT
nr:RHS repeat-associated core domain-containing protein [Burkholderia sp. FL-7-2-10-S1-D7]